MLGQVVEQVDILLIVAAAVYCEVLVTVMEGGTTLQGKENNVGTEYTERSQCEIYLRWN